MLMLGGARNEIFKPILDEFKRWRVLLREPHDQYKHERQNQSLALQQDIESLSGHNRVS